MRQPQQIYPRIAIAGLLLLYAASVFAHDGVHTAAMGFAEGFAHPFSGIDHLLAMLGIGLWAAQNKRSALWVLPLAFPLMMILGAVLATAGMGMSFAELGIASSVAVLGLLIAFAVRMPVWGAAILVSLFGMFHGYSHGVEMPKGAAIGMFGLGFVMATLLLHVAGLAIGLLARHPRALSAVRVSGIGIAAVGMYLLAS
ncbi:HupE/UreJ family protein [Undibacterium sp. TJN25]|uniref:HupE/UreJ family protein n=1 Tax=Undibacterium sp. TJN25 TaxID=3413056 RepID=UPI003BF223D9